MKGTGDSDDLTTFVETLPVLSVTFANASVQIKSSFLPNDQVGHVILPGDVDFSELSMKSTFSSNLRSILPLLEDTLVGVRVSERAAWINGAQQQLQLLVRPTEVFCTRSGKARFAEAIVIYNAKLHVAVVFAPGASSCLLHYFEISHACKNPIELPFCVGCLSIGVDNSDGSVDFADSFGQPGPNTVRQQSNVLKTLVKQANAMSKPPNTAFHVRIQNL